MLFHRLFCLTEQIFFLLRNKLPDAFTKPREAATHPGGRNQCLLIVLDRPTRGLDENGCKELQEILLDLANHGMAVVVLDTRKRNLRDLCSEVAEF